MGAVGTDWKFDSLAGGQRRVQLQSPMIKTAAPTYQGNAAAQAGVDELEKSIGIKAAALSCAN